MTTDIQANTTFNRKLYFPNNSSIKRTVIVQIAGQDIDRRSIWLGLCLGDPSHVYALVTMSSWTFCLHALVYITLVYKHISSASWVLFGLCTCGLQHNARIADTSQLVWSRFSDRIIGVYGKDHLLRHIVVDLLILLLAC